MARLWSTGFESRKLCTSLATPASLDHEDPLPALATPTVSYYVKVILYYSTSLERSLGLVHALGDQLENSPNNPRILSFATAGRTLVLLHGFRKTGRPDDKIPEREVRIALCRMRRYLERRGTP